MTMRNSCRTPWLKIGSAARAEGAAPSAIAMARTAPKVGGRMRILPSLRHRELQASEQRHVVPRLSGHGREKRVVVPLHHDVPQQADVFQRPPGEAARKGFPALGPDVPRAAARTFESLVGAVVIGG